MNIFAIGFMAVNVALLLLLPRRWAPIPFLLGACYMTADQVIEVGPFHFTVIRILVAAGVARIIARGERLAGGMNGLDRLMTVWAAWALISSIFHEDPSAAFIFRLGFVYNACGIYFLLRVFCRSLDDIVALCRVTAILLVPLAVEMLYEKVTSYNLYSLLGGVSETPSIRGGRVRAQGPFAVSILAGTVGAAMLPLVTALWERHRKEAVMGVCACLVIIFASSSSGPILSAIAAGGAMFLWRYRHNMKLIRWAAISGYIALDLVMKDPAYFIMAHIDLAGGSASWYRARLIQSAFEHLSEWWLGGTDFTRHWMASGVSWSMDHTDITNHYLKMGVIGGLSLMVLFIAILTKGFSLVGCALREATDRSREMNFMIWALGASLFAHATSGISVSYFDQSIVFLYLTLGAIGSTRSGVQSAIGSPGISQNLNYKYLVAFKQS